jgi:hypothetical protein
MKIFSFASLVICYEQPKYSDFVKALSRKKSGWGHPVDRIAALYTLCSPLETPTNGQVTCDQSTCALVCDQGLNTFFKQRKTRFQDTWRPENAARNAASINTKSFSGSGLSATAKRAQQISQRHLLACQ